MLALAPPPAARCAVGVVRAVRERPRRAGQETRDRGAGAQAAGGAGAVRHDRAGARGRRPVAGAGVGGGGHRTPDTRAARRPPGNPGRSCDRAGVWFAADRGTVCPDGSRPPERRAARTGHHGHGAGDRRRTEPDEEPGRAVGCRALPWKATFSPESPRWRRGARSAGRGPM